MGKSYTYTIPDELTIYDKIGHEACAKALREYIDAELMAKLTGKSPFKKKAQPYALSPLGETKS
jgi:hypothetical protein